MPACVSTRLESVMDASTLRVVNELDESIPPDWICRFSPRRPPVVLNRLSPLMGIRFSLPMADANIELLLTLVELPPTGTPVMEETLPTCTLLM